MDEDVNDSNYEEIRRQRMLQYIALIVSVVVCATTQQASPIRKAPEPYHTSALTGEAWLIELLTGHPKRIRCELGVHAHVFASLVDSLRQMGHENSRFVSLEEQLAIFLYMSVTGLTIRHVGERFQRSNETISRYFRKLLFIFSSSPFYSEYVRMPASDAIQPEIRKNSRFWPFFKDAIGALDGSHIHAAPAANDRAAYRNRKGFVSQNCLFACDFQLQFTYALTGWEGSATDARIYQDALSKDLKIPEGKYFLADAGFPHRLELMVPYRGIRYHLAEWHRAQLKPQNKEELFNLRHSSARNVIECIFGVLKRRFRILLLSPEYNVEIQARIPAALCGIHNFIRIHDADDSTETEDSDDDQGGVGVDVLIPDGDVENTDTETLHAARVLRDQIAERMWTDYQDRICAGDWASDEEFYSDGADDMIL